MLVPEYVCQVIHAIASIKTSRREAQQEHDEERSVLSELQKLKYKPHHPPTLADGKS